MSGQFWHVNNAQIVTFVHCQLYLVWAFLSVLLIAVSCSYLWHADFSFSWSSGFLWCTGSFSIGALAKDQVLEMVFQLWVNSLIHHYVRCCELFDSSSLARESAIKELFFLLWFLILLQIRWKSQSSREVELNVWVLVSVVLGLWWCDYVLKLHLYLVIC